MSDYLGRKVRPEPYQPIPAMRFNESFVDFYRRTHAQEIQAQEEFTADEREQARLIREAMTSGNWVPGCVVPQRLRALVPMPGMPPGAMDASRETRASLAQQIDLDARMVTDTPHPRQMHTTAPQRHEAMSYRLSQIMNEAGVEDMNEADFDAAVAPMGLKLHERLALKVEAVTTGRVRPRGSYTTTVRQHERTYRPRADARNQHPVRKDSTEADKDTSGLSLTASDSHGFACYDGTGIELLD